MATSLRWVWAYLVVAVVLTACGSGTPTEPGPAASPGEIDIVVDEIVETFEDSDAQYAVFLHADTSQDDIDEFETLLRDAGFDPTFLSQDDAYAEFTAMFDDLDAMSEVTAEDLPTSFRFATERPLDAASIEELESNPHVREVVQPPTREEVADVLLAADDPRNQLSIIYLNPDAGDEGREAVEAMLTDYPDAYFVDQAETEAEFIEFFEVRGEAPEPVPVEGLPPSWRIDLGGEPLPDDLRSELETNEFVRTVKDALG